MRLIDADKLLKQLETKNYSPGSLKLIQNQQTVEAMPIEWVVNWLEKGNKHYCSVDLMLEDWEKENETENE